MSSDSEKLSEALMHMHALWTKASERAPEESSGGFVMGSDVMDDERKLYVSRSGGLSDLFNG